MLEELLKERKCFKLVCGAGNEDVEEVEKLVALYAKAGARYFDLSAKPEVVDAAYRGLRRVVPEEEVKNYYFNVSVGIKGDPHVSKADIDRSKCIACGNCFGACEQEAIISENGYSVNRVRCIGCGKCRSNCPQEAITMLSENKDLNEVLPPLVKKGLSSIELHVVSDDLDKIYEQWKAVTENFDGVLSICTDRSHASDVELKRRIETMIAGRKPWSTIIQADGAPMSGSDDNYSTTLQAVATAQIVQRLDLPVFILLSGGTNSKTTELAQMCDVKAHGIAIGSYGRKLVKEYIQDENFWSEEIFGKALKIAAELVDKCMEKL